MNEENRETFLSNVADDNRETLLESRATERVSNVFSL